MLLFTSSMLYVIIKGESSSSLIITFFHKKKELVVNMKELLSYFPYPHIRPIQKRILDKIQAALDNPQIRYIIIEAGTGVGKSAIAKTLSGYYGESYVLTANKSLQDQYYNAFSNMGAATVKGRSNYACSHDHTMTCAHGKCKEDRSLLYECMRQHECPYMNDIEAMKQSEMAVLSYAFFFTYLKSMESMHQITPRKLIVIDECHLIDDHLINLAKFKIDKKSLNERFHLLDDDTEIADFIKYHKKFQPSNDNDNNYVLQVLISIMENKIQKHKYQMEYKRKIMSNKYLYSPKELAEAEQIDLMALDTDIMDMSKLIDQIRYYLDTQQDGNWITALKEDGTGFFAMPIFSQKLFDKYIGKYARQKCVFMSATIFGKEMFCKELGLDPKRTLYISESSPFNPARSPIVLDPCLSFKYGEYESTIATAVEKVKAITSQLPKYTYMKNRRLIYKHVQESNDYLLFKHKTSRQPTVLVSPSMMSGVDLKDNFSRFQIIMKLPYLSLQDIRIKYLSEHDFCWYATKMLREFMQACGRSTRSEEDWAITYVLDKSFIRIFRQFSQLVPSLKERLVKSENFDLEDFLKKL